jgi:ribosome modulation factor
MRKQKKNLIERAYREGEKLGLAVWTQDEAGPYPTRPMPGQSWAEQGQAQRQPHEYVRNGTAKLLTLFCPNSGEVRAKGVTTAPNAVLHPWLQQELTAVLDQLPSAPVTDAGVGQPARACDASTGIVAVQSWRDAPVHTAERLVAEHGRVDPAHNCSGLVPSPLPFISLGTASLSLKLPSSF